MYKYIYIFTLSDDTPRANSFKQADLHLRKRIKDYIYIYCFVIEIKPEREFVRKSELV